MGRPEQVSPRKLLRKHLTCSDIPNLHTKNLFKIVNIEEKSYLKILKFLNETHFFLMYTFLTYFPINLQYHLNKWLTDLNKSERFPRFNAGQPQQTSGPVLDSMKSPT